VNITSQSKAKQSKAKHIILTGALDRNCRRWHG